MQLIKTCSLNLIQTCQFLLAGISELYVGYSKNSDFTFFGNIITDITPISWNKIKFSNAKISLNLVNGLEELVLDFDVPYIDSNNGIQLKKLQDVEYSFLILTKNKQLFFLDSLKNTQLIRQYGANGFVIKEITTKNKSLYEVDYNYYLYLTNQLPIPPFDDCVLYSNDLALSSTQGPALVVQCSVDGYNGWVEP